MGWRNNFGVGWHYHAQTLQGHLTNIKQSSVNSDAAQVLASSPKDVLQSTVFSCCRKAASDCSSLTKDGREFQAQAAAAGNERSPRVRRRVAWNNQCRRDSRAQATAGTAAGCQMQGLGEVPWRCTMKASESHNIEPKLYPVRNSQPMEFTE